MAPQYVIIEAHTGYAGDSGDLDELRWECVAIPSSTPQS